MSNTFIFRNKARLFHIDLETLPLPQKGPRAKSRFAEMKRLLCNGIIRKPKRKGHNNHTGWLTPRERVKRRKAHDKRQQELFKGVHWRGVDRQKVEYGHRSWWNAKQRHSAKMVALASEIWLLERGLLKSKNPTPWPYPERNA